MFYSSNKTSKWQHIKNNVLSPPAAAVPVPSRDHRYQCACSKDVVVRVRGTFMCGHRSACSRLSLNERWSFHNVSGSRILSVIVPAHCTMHSARCKEQAQICTRAECHLQDPKFQLCSGSSHRPYRHSGIRLRGYDRERVSRCLLSRLEPVTDLSLPWADQFRAPSEVRYVQETRRRRGM